MSIFSVDFAPVRIAFKESLARSHFDSFARNPEIALVAWSDAGAVHVRCGRVAVRASWRKMLSAF